MIERSKIQTNHWLRVFEDVFSISVCSRLSLSRVFSAFSVTLYKHYCPHYGAVPPSLWGGSTSLTVEAVHTPPSPCCRRRWRDMDRSETSMDTVYKAGDSPWQRRTFIIKLFPLWARNRPHSWGDVQQRLERCSGIFTKPFFRKSFQKVGEMFIQRSEQYNSIFEHVERDADGNAVFYREKMKRHKPVIHCLNIFVEIFLFFTSH